MNIDEMSEEEINTEAKAMGHSSIEEWKGDQDKWIDAKEFLRRGEEFLPFVKKRLAEAEKTISGYADFQAKQAAQNELNVEAAKKSAFEEARHKLVEEQAQAVEEGEGDAIRNTHEKISQLDADYYAAPKTDPNAIAFKNKNASWFKDRTMYREMKETGDWLMATGSFANSAEYFTELESEMGKIIEAKTARTKETIRSLNDTGTPSSTSNTKHKSFKSLSQTAKDAFTRLANNGVYKNNAEGQKKYAASYSKVNG
ncbi:hypothetical protein KAR91_20290 [Candidatus Pacearchaeota archaeon]|nr:hypothetical protein [Candidatus Pacearchaeota archaeon]